MILLDLFTFLGRMHPLIIHLPIGFLLLAVIFDSIAYHRKFDYLRQAVPFTLLIGFAFALAASVLGYLLSLTGDYDQQILTNHKVSGISLTIMAGVLYAVTTARFRKVLAISRPLFSALSLATFVLVSYTGHQGASLTHGNNYLSMETLLHQRREKPTQIEEAFIFEDVVHPILENRCFQCHRPDKKKGKLSMQNLEAILKGGKHGPAVVPGKLDESELFKRISLDPSHEDFMPTDGKTPLTKSEAEIIRWWIEKGLAAEGKKITSIENHEEIIPVASSVLGLNGPAVGKMTISRRQNAYVNIPDTIDLALVDHLRKNGLVVRIMQHEPVMLDVTLPARSGVKMTDMRDDLKPIARNIIWLNFSDNNFTEGELEILKDMANLEKLRLEKNPISDGISDHLEGLKYLEAVNLNETRITNACLERLQKNPAIKRIYTWKTKCDVIN